MKYPERRCGILMHPTSLPSSAGIGSFGKEAYQFIDLMASAHLTLWQMLPLGPTGYGDSPYASRSSFAGNELLIDLEQLAFEGYLDLEDVADIPSFPGRVNYGAVREYKTPLLRKAAGRVVKKGGKEFASFCEESSSWLSDYALYAVLCEEYQDSRWYLWPDEVKTREPKAIAKLEKKFASEIAIVKAIQYLFFMQYSKVKAYANKQGISIIGDIPIFVAGDSVDVWTHRELFQLDEDGNQLAGGGVPPDAFSADGQLWGNPLYLWEAHEKEDFSWWMQRMERTFDIFDIVRIDHFRGFAAYWSVPADKTSAKFGKWEKGPGNLFFAKMRERFGENMPVIAEDLGVIDADVEALRDDNNLPGMKILQFAFGFDKAGALDATNDYLPHNCGYNSVIYTGTHDNNTTWGWYASLPDGMKDLVRRYYECSDSEVLRKMVRSAVMSHCRYAVIPMQDWLSLGEDARMNCPGSLGTSNWSWRMSDMNIEQWRVDTLRSFIDMAGRFESDTL